MIALAYLAIVSIIACVVLDGTRGPGKCAVVLVAFGVLLAAGK